MKSAGNSRLPEGWSEARVADVIAHYETQSEAEAVAEDQAALSGPGQTVMVIPTRLVPAVRELLASPCTYASALRAAIEKYRFPAVTWDFVSEQRICHADMAAVEKYVETRLHAEDPRVVKDGLANVLYWGYANSPGLQGRRVGRFRDEVTEEQLQNFRKIARSGRQPGLLDIKRIGLPEFGGMSFVTKVMMFLDPGSYPVLDLTIAKAFSQSKDFPPLRDLVLQRTTIPITRNNECVYREWASWCRGIAASVNAESDSSGKTIRAVDVERAVFALADACDRTEVWRLLGGPCAKDRMGWSRDEETAR